MGCPKVAIVAIVILFFAATGFAQLYTGTITVAVRDSTGAAVPSANVVLSNENTGIDARSGVTDEQENFNAPLIPSGSYYFSNPGSNVDNLVRSPDGSILNLNGFSTNTSVNTRREGIDERLFRVRLHVRF
jgi:hypothetical protein